MKNRLLLVICSMIGVGSFGQPKKGDARPLEIIVATDGSGTYKTVQQAFDAVPNDNTMPVTIFIKNGLYKEKLKLPQQKKMVTIVGEDKFKTILTFDDHTGTVAPGGTIINTRTSYSFLIEADDFTAKNIRFQNDAGFTAGQAVAVACDGDKAIFFNCRFLGFQDVLFLNNPRGRQYFNNCYIEGTTDFIFGASTAWFEKCHIHSKKNSHVTAASTPKENAAGFVFYDCVLTGDTSLHSVSLGRPWQPYSSVTYLRCYLGAHILGEGWNNWKNPANEKTARYGEYENYGPGATTTARLGWIKQLTEAESKEFTLKNIFGTWNPLEQLKITN